jgi:hypothetical protein
MALSPRERTESARKAAQARWQGGWEMSGKPLLTFEEWSRLGPDGIDEIVRYIKRAAPGKSVLSLSVSEYRALSNFSKAIQLQPVLLRLSAIERIDFLGGISNANKLITVLRPK